MNGQLRTGLIISGVVVVLVAIAAWHNGRTGSVGGGVRLTDDLAEAWVASTEAEDVGDALNKASADGSSVNVADPEAVRAAGKNRRLAKAVRAHGFSSGDQWAEVTIKMMAVQLGDMLPAMEAKSETAAAGDAQLQAAMGLAYAETHGWIDAVLANMTKDEVSAAREAGPSGG